LFDVKVHCLRKNRQRALYIW